jgi:acyl-CoA synthetase (AMP-forming)/AMP-acid ligase II
VSDKLGDLRGPRTGLISPADVDALLTRTIDAVRPDDEPASRRPVAEIIAEIAELGLPPGSAIVIALANGVDFLAQYFAVLCGGWVPVALSPAVSSERIDLLAEHIGAGALITTRIGAARCNADGVFRVGAHHAVHLEPGPGGLASYQPGQVLMLTSGTSGMFSACLHESGSLLRNARRHAGAVGLRNDDVILVSLPLYYSYAIVAQAFAALVTGARLVISGPPFSVPFYTRTIARFGITSSSITPTIARTVLQHGSQLAAGLRMLTVGGDQLAPTLVSRLLAWNPGGELYTTYGLTEAGPRVATLAAHAEPAHRLASVGLPMTGVDVSIADPDGDGVGELLVSTDTALLRTVGITSRDVLQRPGLIRTGDLFRIDGDGYLYFQGRLSDFVLVGGEKVSLHSVRLAAHSIPGVLRCVPVARTDEDGRIQLDIEVHVAAVGAVTPEIVRERLNRILLPVERPQNIFVRAAETVTAHK